MSRFRANEYVNMLGMNEWTIQQPSYVPERARVLRLVGSLAAAVGSGTGGRGKQEGVDILFSGNWNSQGRFIGEKKIVVVLGVEH